MQVPNPQYQYAALAANSTTQVKKTSGLLGSFIPSVSGTFSAFDNASGDNTVPTIIAATAVTAGTPLPIGALFNRGLTVILAGGAAGTVLYN